MPDIGEFLLGLGQAGNAGGGELEQLMQKGQAGELTEQEAALLAQRYNFKPDAFKPVWAAPGFLRYRLEARKEDAK